MSQFENTLTNTIQNPITNNETGIKKPLLHITCWPFIKSSVTVPNIMFWVIIALIPSLISSIYTFGIRSLVIVSICVITTVFTETIFNLLSKKKNSIYDFSAIITGLLLAFNLPPSIPYWIAVLGSIFAIAIVKMAFNGLGGNFVNPALAGRVFLMISFPAAMTNWSLPNWGLVSNVNAVSSATVLSLMKSNELNIDSPLSTILEKVLQLLWGNPLGCIGETSAIALLVGAIILIFKKVISWEIPCVFIGTVFIASFISTHTFHHLTAASILFPTFQILSGGLLLGAFFMATDPVTSPLTTKGKILFGVGCGLITFLIRGFGSYPEGVSYSILTMNLLVPLIDYIARPRTFGHKTI